MITLSTENNQKMEIIIGCKGKRKEAALSQSGIRKWQRKQEQKEN